MKKKLEIQTIIVLVLVLTVAGAWIGIEVGKDNLGLWSEAAELKFTTPDLMGLGVRSELRTAGAVVGHVRKVDTTLGPDGRAQFTLTAGVKKDFAAWKFAPVGVVKAGVVQSALAPSSIALELSTAPDALTAVLPKQGTPPVLPLKKEESPNDFNKVAERYVKLADQIEITIRQFTDPQHGRELSVLDEFSRAIPAAAASLAQLETVSTQVSASLADGGQIDQALTALNANLANLEELTGESSTVLRTVNGRIDTSLAKINTLLDETTLTMDLLQDKMQRFGGTFVGRMIIGKPDAAPSPSPTPAKKR
jgi:ABC-type transporter Mla subunit MlaD